MGRYSLSLLAGVFVMIGIVAWFYEPTRRVDWKPMVALGVALSAVDSRIRDLQRQLNERGKASN